MQKSEMRRGLFGGSGFIIGAGSLHFSLPEYLEIANFIMFCTVK